jgi:hypothetical protein
LALGNLLPLLGGNHGPTSLREKALYFKIVLTAHPPIGFLTRLWDERMNDRKTFHYSRTERAPEAGSKSLG